MLNQTTHKTIKLQLHQAVQFSLGWVGATFNLLIYTAHIQKITA